MTALRYVQRTRDALIWLDSGSVWAVATLIVGAIVVGVALAAIGQLDAAILYAFPILLILLMLLATRRFVLLTGVVVACAIFVDHYEIVGRPLHEPVVAIALASVILAVIFFTQSAERPWVRLRNVLIWAALLGLAAIEVPRGGSLTQTVTYYVEVFGTSIVMYVLGTQVIRTYNGLRLLILLLMYISAFIALHTIIQGATGKFLFVTAHEAEYLSSSNNFHLAGSTLIRAGSFLLNPDWNGLYLAVSLFIAAGVLFTPTRSRVIRLSAAATCLALVVALLFTFTTASWLSAGVGFVVFVVAFVPRRSRWWTLGGAAGMAALVGGVFYRQTRSLLTHATSGGDAKVRLGAWETALHIIARYPLTGIGMGYNLYLSRSVPYIVKLQTQRLAHPHNSYLELAAFAGLPVFLAFMAVLALAFRDAIRAYRLTPPRYQPLVGGVITALVTLSVNSFFINGWTLPPFACIGWLLFGAITSRALLASREPDADAPDATHPRTTPEVASSAGQSPALATVGVVGDAAVTAAQAAELAGPPNTRDDSQRAPDGRARRRGRQRPGG